MKVYLTKTLGANFVAADPDTEEMAKKMKPGDVLHGTFSRMRNPKFHAKAFAMFTMAFEHWTPGEVISRYGMVAEKNFKQFRNDLTILAGFYHTVARLDGSARIEADSLSFGSMDEDTFQKVYQAILSVIIERIINVSSIEEVDKMVDKFLLGFG